MTESRLEALQAVEGGLIVSCQARDGEPMGIPVHVAAFARSAELGGAIGLRVDGSASIVACRAQSALPIIGIKKVRRAGARPAISPDLAGCREIVSAGATIVAIDASREYQPSDSVLARYIADVHDSLGVPVTADVSSLDEALRAHDLGADSVATTLWGYTPLTRHESGPAIALAAEIAARGIRVIVEGRVNSPRDAVRAFEAGAFAVVVGSAITNPVYLTEQFRDSLRRYKEGIGVDIV